MKYPSLEFELLTTVAFLQFINAWKRKMTEIDIDYYRVRVATNGA